MCNNFYKSACSKKSDGFFFFLPSRSISLLLLMISFTITTIPTERRVLWPSKHMAKTYDRVEWCFLKATIEFMGSRLLLSLWGFSAV
jgi:hypothetical protein